MEIQNRWASFSQTSGLWSSCTDRLATDSGTWKQVRDIALSHPVVSQFDCVACDADYESLDELLWLLISVRMSVELFDEWDEALFASVYQRVLCGLQQAACEYSRAICSAVN